MPEMTHEAMEELVAGYALDALEEDERVRVGLHVEKCAACQEVYAEMLETAEALALSCVQGSGEVPSGVKTRIMGEILEGSRVPTVEKVLPESVGRMAAMRWLSRSTSWQRSMAGALSLIVLLVIGGAVVGSVGRPVNSSHSVVADPGARSVALVSQSGSSKVTVGQAVLSSKEVYVVANAMAPTAAGQEYVLWGMRDGKPVGLASFQVSSSPMTMHVPMDASGMSTVAVSLEEGSGIPAAPSRVVALGEKA